MEFKNTKDNIIVDLDGIELSVPNSMGYYYNLDSLWELRKYMWF